MAALLAACTVARGHSRRTCSTAGQEALQLSVDGGRILGDAGEVGHDADELDLGDAPDGLEESVDGRREQALAVHPAVDLEVNPGPQAGALEVGEDVGHVVAHHGEIHVLVGHLLVLVEAVERAHDQDHVVKPASRSATASSAVATATPCAPAATADRATGSVPWP